MIQVSPREQSGGTRPGVSPNGNDTLVVRPVRRTDLDQVIAIDATVTGLEKRKYWASVFRRYGAGGSSEPQFLVALVQGRVVGFVIGEVRDWEFGSPPCGWVFAIDVLSHREFAPQSSTPLRMTIRGEEILDFRFAVINLGRLEARQYARKLNAAAMALSARMRMDPASRIPLAVDFIHNTIRAKWTPRELDAVSRFYFAYQEFVGKEGLKLRRKLGSIRNMRIPKEVLRRNPFVWVGIAEGREEGRQEGRREGRYQGEIELVLRQLNRRLGALAPRQQQAIRRLPLTSIEALGEALLDFHAKTDLTRWLKSHSK